MTLCVKHYKTHCLLLKSNCLLLMSIWSLMFIGEKHQCFHIFLLGHPASHPNFGRSSSCSIVKLLNFHDFHGWKKIPSCFTSHFQNVFFFTSPIFPKVELRWPPLVAPKPAGPRSHFSPKKPSAGVLLGDGFLGRFQQLLLQPRRQWSLMKLMCFIEISYPLII